MIYIALLLPVLIGGGLIVVDAGRIFNLSTLLQQGADALAIAAAKELDGQPSALDRADAALANLVHNEHRFGASGIAEVTYSRRFLNDLPPNDADPITIEYETVDPLEARFVEVTVTPVTLNTIFPAAFIGAGPDNASVNATAVAGFSQVVCEFTPVFICNPYEGSGISIFDVLNDPDLQRRQINLKRRGGETSQYSPGNYGFLQPVDNPGADALRDQIGMSRPPTCFEQPGVTLRPGFVSTVRDAVNTRFDMYNGPMNAHTNNPEFRPARNVRKGYTGPDCNPAPDENDPPQNLGLTKDMCFETGTCPYMDGRMGDGEWDFDAYWAKNYGHEAAGNIPPPSNGNGPFQCNPTLCDNPPSRYKVYRYEIDNGLLDTPSEGGEVGAPQCSDSATNDEPDRRMLYGAVLNCVELGIDGGASGPYPVKAFVKFFLTEPVLSGPDEDIFVEIVDLFEPGGDSTEVVRDDVQLYR